MINYTDLIGAPFKNRGRGDGGYDCYGLVKEIFHRCGHEIPEYSADFDNIEAVDALIRGKTAIKSNWQRCDTSKELPVPCLMAIRFGVPRGIVNHTGVYIGSGKFIHIRENIGVCVDRVESPAWKRMIEGFYKYVGDADGRK